MPKKDVMPTTNDTYPTWLPAMKWLLSPFRAPGYTVKKDHTAKFDALPSVSYEQLRHTIRNGDLLFCGGNFAFSKIIRYLSGQSKVSHVGIVYWWNERLMLLESVETDGVRIVPVSQYVENYENRGAAYNGRIYLARDQRVTIAPTNKAFKLSMVTIGRWEDGVMKEEWLYWDNQVFMRQFGLGQ